MANLNESYNILDEGYIDDLLKNVDIPRLDTKILNRIVDRIDKLKSVKIKLFKNQAFVSGYEGKKFKSKSGAEKHLFNIGHAYSTAGGRG